VTNDGGQGTGEWGPGTGDRGPGTGDRGPQTGDRGPWSVVYGRWSFVVRRPATFLKRLCPIMLVMMNEHYSAYLVRIWRDSSNGQWRAQVVPVGETSSEGRFFTDPSQLLLYWFAEAVGTVTPPLNSQGDESR
jgi:hypothetical protein